MLFLLTGDVQIGKTRWLERLLVGLADEGVASCGVIAPGVWRTRMTEEREATGVGAYEKLGIDNVLLPGGERLSFARRRDLAMDEGTYDSNSQSAAAKLAWEISDEAIARVNAHFAALANASMPAQSGQPGFGSLLVVDELGQLELVRGGGLTAAMSLLDAGPTARFPHALVVVRAWLAERAEARFAETWSGSVALGPTDEARLVIRRAFGLPG